MLHVNQGLQVVLMSETVKITAESYSISNFHVQWVALGSRWFAHSDWVGRRGRTESLEIWQSPRCCQFFQFLRHTLVTLSTHWHHLGNFTNCWCLGHTLTDADFNELGCSLGIKILKSFVGESRVVNHVEQIHLHAHIYSHPDQTFPSSLNHVLQFLSGSVQKMLSVSKMTCFLN